MYLRTSTRHGVAAKEIERQLGVSALGACATSCGSLWLLPTIKARSAGPGKHVEVDETLIGGKSLARGFGSRLYKKTMVMGMVERGRKMRAGPVPDDRIDTPE